MTLTRRLTFFFLTWLAVVLIGFSIALYLLADRHLNRQLDDRLLAAACTIASAAEVRPDGVEWEPGPRPNSLEPGGFGDQLEWAATTEGGHIVDHSPHTNIEALLAAATDAFRSDHHNPLRLDQAGRVWRVTRLRLEPAAPSPDHTGREQQHHDEPKKEVFYPALILTVAVPLDPILTTLRTLAATLAGLTTAVLVIALVAGRAVCRRALAPVARMAEAAQSMGAVDLTDRLPLPATKDELVELGTAFNGLLDRVGEAFERERRFAGEASHQLRTPLAAVMGQVEVALRRDRTGEEYRRVLDSVLSQTERLCRIVEALLFLARSEKDTALPGRERVELSTWIPERLRAWKDHPRGSDLAFDSSSGNATTLVHPDLFGELLGALLDNSLKYSEPGSPVTVRSGGQGMNAWVEVEDRGTGIATDDLPQLFRPFFRSESARKRGVPGAGLGLAVAARIAAALGGSVTVESEPGQGSRFRVNLPAVADRPEPESTVASSPGPLVTTAGSAERAPASH